MLAKNTQNVGQGEAFVDVPAMFCSPDLGIRNTEMWNVSLFQCLGTRERVPGDQGEGEPVRKPLVRVKLFKGTMSPITVLGVRHRQGPTGLCGHVLQ